MLLTDSSFGLKQLMKYTFMDLLLKKVIEIKVEKRRVLEEDENGTRIEVIRSYDYVICGKNFGKYTPKKHEVFFLPLFNNPKSFKILFLHFVIMAYENIDSLTSFKKAVLKSENLKGLLKANIFQKLFGWFSLTKAGKEAARDILIHLNPVDDDIQELISNDQKKALSLLLGLGGNILLLRNLDFELMNKIDPQLWKEHKSTIISSYGSGDRDYDHDVDSDWQFYFDYYDDNSGVEANFDEFESIIDTLEIQAANSSSYESDCDSGCSSCGGCGGCD